MRFLSRTQSIVVIITLLVIAAVSFSNFKVALRRARDTQRKNDVGDIATAVSKYQNDFSYFPISYNGKIKACGKADDSDYSPCEWGKDGLADITDPKYPAYIGTLPNDPDSASGVSYVYFSDGRRFQIYAALEGQDEAEYNPKIVARKISCGVKICNFGLASGNTPLDKSIEEYENELMIKSLPLILNKKRGQ